MTRRIITLLLLTMSFTLVSCSLGGCAAASFTPEQQQLQIKQANAVVDAMKGASAQLAAVSAEVNSFKQAAATMPSISTDVGKGADKVIQQVDQAKRDVDAVTHITDVFSTILQNQQTQNADVLTKIVAVTQAVHDATHDVAPGTKPDDTTALVAIGALAISKIISSFNSKSTLKAAITTPGTTTSPGA